MKTAEEWKQIWWSWPMPNNSGEFEGQKEFLKLVPQIQLDALKEGMRRAATMVFPFDAETSNEDDAPWLAERKRILTAAEQLTEKDLQ